MPAPLNIDREQVRMLVLSVGVREAAAKMGLPVATVGAWSARGNWLRQPPAPLPPTMKPVQTVHTKPSEALADSIADDQKRSRVALHRLARTSLEAAEKAGPLPVASMQDLRHAAAIVEPKEGAGETRVTVNLAFFGG